MKTKVVSISQSQESKTDDHFSNKISIAELRKIWNDEQHTYTDEQLTRIRDWLYVIAHMVISVSKRIEKEHSEHQAKIISLQSTQNETKSNLVHQSEYRRAS
jgi:hypothetical protein